MAIWGGEVKALTTSDIINCDNLVGEGKVNRILKPDSCMW